MAKSNAARKAMMSTASPIIVANDDVPDSDELDDVRGIREIKDAIALSEKIGEPVVIRTQICARTATWLLGDNRDNRKVSENTEIKYADDLINGRWQENGDGLSISKCLALNNGQHRCLAVESTGVAIMTNVTVGLTRDSRSTNDIGLARTISNQLAMDGYKNHGILGPMAKLIIGWQNSKGATKRSAREISNQLIRDEIAADKKIDESAEFVRTVNVPKGFLSKPQIGFFHYVLKEHAPKDVECFLVGLIMNKELVKGAKPCPKTGKPVYAALLTNDPRYVAHARLSHAKRERINITQAERVEIVFRAWNAWREGRDMTQCKVLGTIPDLV